MMKLLSLMVMAGFTTCLCAQNLQVGAVKAKADKQFKIMSARPIKHDVNVEVLEARRMPDGRTMQVVKDTKGRIYKRNAATAKSNGIMRFNAPAAKVQNVTFSENFESWTEDLGNNWIPKGWTEINTPGNTPTDDMLNANVNNTWAAYYTGDGYWTAMTEDGEKDCFIHFTYTQMDGHEPYFEAAEQDEWLITPAVTPVVGDKLMFSAAIDLGMLVKFDWNTGKYDRNIQTCNLEVLVSADNGENWTHLWDAWNDMASPMTDKELSNLMMSMVYYDLSIDIAEYAGKSVKFAFRYTTPEEGKFEANSVSVDAVKVGIPAAEAYYMMPAGTLYAGLSEDFWGSGHPTAVMPAYTPIKWEAACNDYTETVEWTFMDEQGNELTDSATSPEKSFPYAKLPAPSLTASNAFSSSTYTWGVANPAEDISSIQYGGVAAVNTEDGEVTLGLGNYDYYNYGITTLAFDNNAFCFGTDPDANYGYPVVAIGNVFEKPAAPLYTDGLFLTLEDVAFDADNDAELYANIYEVNKYGDVDKLLATAKAKVSDKYTESGFVTLPFKFYQTVDGAEVPATFMLDRDVIVEIDGFYNNLKVRKFGAMTQYENHPDGRNHAYLKIHIEEDGYAPTDSWYGADELLEDCNTSLVMTFSGAFDFMQAEKQSITLPASGGSESVKIDACFGSDNWSVVDGENIYPLTSATTLDGWLKVAPSADGIMFSAEASHEARTKTFVVVSKGAEVEMTVSQATETGIDADIETARNVVVKANGGQIVINGANAYAGQMARIYDSAGRLLGKAVIDGNGSAAIYTTAASGVVIVKVGDISIKSKLN